MKKIALITISLLCSIVILAQGVKGFVNKQLQTYPQLRLLDLYKSCFQNYMGAEHLVSDRQRVKAYLNEELSTTTLDDLMPEAYHPHYRIVERGIFERELKPLIEHKYLQNKNNDMDDKKQIEQLYKQMYQAMIAKDIATLNTILAEGSVLIHMTGTKQPKKQYLHEIENGTLNYYSVEDDEISITVNGTTAEMTGRSRVNAAVYGGGRHTWRLQMKSKLAKNDGRWQFVESKASTY